MYFELRAHMWLPISH